MSCGGQQGQDDSYYELGDAAVTAASEVRGAFDDMEPGTKTQVGETLVENLEDMMDAQAVASHKDTYQNILDAAKKLAEGDKSQVAEITILAETLPK